MSLWSSLIVLAAMLSVAIVLYVIVRWRRAPTAFRAIRIAAAASFVTGSLFGAWVLHLAGDFEGPASHRSEGLIDGEAAGSRLDERKRAAAESTSVQPRTFTAQVIGITDGDTIRVREAGDAEDTVRLAGVDAPEHDQAFGAQSTAHLRALAWDASVTVACGGHESYGRAVCKVLLSDGEDVCLDQIKAGLAWHSLSR